MSEAEWRPVKGFPNYQVSNTGLVRNIKRGEKLLSMGKWGSYHRACLHLAGKKHYFSVHRLVAIAFVHKPDKYKNKVNHIDGNKQNNHVSNLEWVTDSENQLHALDVLKVRTHGEASPNVKLKLAQVVEIKARRKEGATYSQIAAEYNVSYSTIQHIINGKSWSRAINEQI